MWQVLATARGTLTSRDTTQAVWPGVCLHTAVSLYLVVAARPGQEAGNDKPCSRKVGDARQRPPPVVSLQSHPEEENPALREQTIPWTCDRIRRFSKTELMFVRTGTAVPKVRANAHVRV